MIRASMGTSAMEGANAVVVFDRISLQSIAAIPAGTNPDGIVFEPVTKPFGHSMAAAKM